MAPAVQSSPVFDFPGDNHTGDAFLIDAEAVKHRPIRDHFDFYSESGKSVTTLVLSEIPEEDVELILSLFTCIKHLTLEKVQILNEDIEGLPTKIECLKLVKCGIVEPVIENWFESMSSELVSVLISDSYYAVPLSTTCAFIELLMHLPNTVRHVKVEDHNYDYVYFDEFPRTEYVYLDISNRAYMKCMLKPQLQTLVLRLQVHHWNRQGIIQELENLSQLKHLRIIDPVPMEFVHKLQSLLNLETLDVFCYEPPEEVNKILMLNDDCLEEIFSYLEQKDWIALTQVHPRFDHLVGTVILPHKKINWNNNTIKIYPKKVQKVILKRLGETVKSLIVQGADLPEIISHFKSLETLSIEGDEWNSEIRRAIPHSIKRLKLNCDLSRLDVYNRVRKRRNGEYSATDLFKYLNPQLVSLKLKKDFRSRDLVELHNIRKFTCKSFNPRDLQFLRQNHKQMEFLEIWFDKDWSRQYGPSLSFRFCPMGALKTLNLIQVNFKIDLKPEDLPSLEEIDLSFFLWERGQQLETQQHILECISKFTNLKKLQVWELSDCKLLYKMKSLESLYAEIEVEEFLNLIKELPKLRKVDTSGCQPDWSFEFETELRQYLIGANRTLQIYRDTERILVYP